MQHTHCLSSILDAVSDEPVLPTAESTPFAPTLLKSATYLMSLSMQLATFAINYQGHPFRESLRENKSLWKSLCIVGGITISATVGIFPELNRWMELVTWPEDTWFREQLLAVMLGDWILCAAIEWISWYLFGRKPRKNLNALRISGHSDDDHDAKKNQ
jgi:cation-transporting ATPase 13A1